MEFPAYTIAQTEFAPVGAKWFYSYFKDTEYPLPVEYFTYESVKDTMVNGKNCRKLDIWYFSVDYKKTYWGFDLIYSDSNRVYYFYKNKFQLLYDFNVKVGDTLKLLLYNPNIPRLLDLTDTHYVKYRVRESGTIKINNENLRYYDLNTINIDTLIVFGQQLCFNDRIIEKLGDTNFLFGKIISWSDVYRIRSNLRCYSDNNFTYQANNDVPCDTFISSIKNDFAKKSTILIYPNPVNENFYLEFESNRTYNKASFRIIDLTGHDCNFELKKINDRTYSIDISKLNAGSYFLIISGQKPIYQKLLKL